MHFEISDELCRKWSAEGRLGQRPEVPARILVLGDRGPEVATVQRRLNREGFKLKSGWHFRSRHASRCKCLSGNEKDCCPTGWWDQPPSWLSD